jgi:exodeoxyribonuclease V gamma subunit
MPEGPQRLFEDVLPLDDVGSGAIELAGRFAELVDRLGVALDALGGTHDLAGWTASITAAVDALTATGQRDAWQRAELDRILDDVGREAGASATELALSEVRALLAERLQGRPTRANFRTGHLTVCTLMPMRSVPHRVVCLLGMDEGVFPRKSPRDGDDLMLRDPHVGDRDPRTEDRQLLLDALMSSTDRLIATYSGNDERTNVPRPPAVPLNELLDVADRTVRTADGRPARDRVIVRHPLQPFDERNFRPGALVGDEPWSFDPVTLQGARALGSERARVAEFLAGRLPPLEAPIVDLGDLVRFVERPVRAFLRRRLDVTVGEADDDVADALSVELDGLQRWSVGTRLVEGVLAGATLQECERAELVRGSLPPGLLARPVLARIRPVVQEIVRATQELVGPGTQAGSLDVRVALHDGRALGGTVAGVCGDVLRTVTFARLSPRHRLAAWVRLLALSAAYPDRPFQALTVGQARRSGAPDGAQVTIARIRPIGAERAQTGLRTVVDLWERGMREPLPLACMSAAAYAAAAERGENAVAAARAEWESGWAFPREDAEPEHQLVLGGIVDFDALLEQPPAPDEAGLGWDDGETTRFGRLARRLWSHLLVDEELTDL